MKKAFTLIELLVVVLIVGVLSGIALPQYKKSIAKARAAEALANIKTLAQAAEVSIMANGKMAATFEELGIDLPGTVGIYRVPGDRIITKNYYYTLAAGRVDIGAIDREQQPCFLYATDLSVMAAPVAGSRLYCYYIADTPQQDERLSGLCLMMGGHSKSVAHGRSIWYALD